MSHLLKRTKKSCLKIFRKISSSKQLFAKKSDEVDDTSSPNHNNNNNSHSINSNNSNNSNISNNNNNHISYQDHSIDETVYSLAVESSPMPHEKVNESFRKSTESLPSMTYHQHDIQPSPKKILIPRDFNGDEESPSNTTILHKLTTRLFLTADGYDFHRLQQLRSDTGSEVVQFDVDSTTTFTEDNIVFEKVRFKDDVRYFRHTPSNTSLDNYRPNSVATTPDYVAQFEMETEWTTATETAMTTADTEAIERAWRTESVGNPFTNFGFQAPRETFRPKINMSLGSKLNGNLQNVIISQERDNNNKLTPVVKWDINGNSLDDDDDLLPHEYLEDFDKRLSKRIAAVQQLQTTDQNESTDSSLRSSSTTLETWVDEDLILDQPPTTLNDTIEMQLRENRCLIKA